MRTNLIPIDRIVHIFEKNNIHLTEEEIDVIFKNSQYSGSRKINYQNMFKNLGISFDLTEHNRFLLTNYKKKFTPSLYSARNPPINTEN